MTVRQILQGDIPELREVSDAVSCFDEELKHLVDDLADTLREHRGLSLAAPQIGVTHKVFVIDAGDGIQAFINPEIVEASGQAEGYESCLSFPSYTLKISRPKQVSLVAQDVSGQRVHVVARDLVARLICHEVDLLNGILFMDHLSDEEVFTQLLENAVVLDGDQHPDETPMDPRGLPEELVAGTGNSKEAQARQEELQLVADMLSELEWKLALSLEILKDYAFGDSLPWEGLKDLTHALEETIQRVEERIPLLETGL